MISVNLLKGSIPKRTLPHEEKNFQKNLLMKAENLNRELRREKAPPDM